MSEDQRLNQLYSMLNKEEDQRELYNIFIDMIDYKYNFNLKSSTKDDVRNHINDEELVNSIYQIIEHMENSIYSRVEEDFDLKKAIKKVYKEIS